MNPTVAQQLQSMKLRMEETIIPEINEDATFAREQAAFIVMTLDWLMQTHEHQYRYEVVENAEYRALVSRMLDASGDLPNDEALRAQVQHVLREPGPAPQEAVIRLSELIGQNRRLKQLTAQIFNALCRRSTSDADAARALIGGVSINQGNRELAFFKGTGFTNTSYDLGQLLGETAGVTTHP
ncbi:hypothetical protein [Burkholderia sp. S171]|uniref:hypothetical protein n=1 Tax=Burkholderia sp. S171 TaxID=1641860 RepID=UPI00131D6819|nr:hypothetical protein [Burkholderia sp. S171]